MGWPKMLGDDVTFSALMRGEQTVPSTDPEREKKWRGVWHPFTGLTDGLNELVSGVSGFTTIGGGGDRRIKPHCPIAARDPPRNTPVVTSLGSALLGYCPHI